MKKSIVFAAIAAIPFFAFAQSANTITFRGEVAEQTCSVAVNGNASSPVVLLPTVSTADLASAGATAGQTEFTVSVSGCTANVTPQAVNTVFLPNSVTPAGNILNTGTAANVSLQLLDPAAPGTPFPLTGGFAAPGLQVAANETSASHNFAVRYYAENAAVGAGSVVGAVQYSVAYP
jgi:major type 1 subunit fimbrin (pilin)